MDIFIQELDRILCRLCVYSLCLVEQYLVSGPIVKIILSNYYVRG